MRTDDLIAMLGTNVEPVNHRRVAQTVSSGIAIGAATSLGLTLVASGVRTDLNAVGAWTFLAVKLGFAVAIVAVSSVHLVRAARPGGERKTPVAILTLPFTVMIVLAAISVAYAPSSHWSRMVVGDRWLECLVSIPVIAVVPFAAVAWAVRRSAPTSLERAGALTGLVAGGVSAAGYALHCTDDSLPFIALWYGGAVALCALVGAMLGPRLLRW